MSNVKGKAPFFYPSFILLQSIIWGIGNPLTKIGLQSITPFYCLAFRFTLASLVFLLFYKRNFFNMLKQGKWLPIFLISVSCAGGFICCNIALKLTSATNVGFLMSLSVVFTPLISLFVLKTPIHKKQVMLIGVVMAGLYLLCRKEQGFTFNFGDFLALLCAISLGASLTFCSKYVSEIDVAAMSTVQTIFIALVSWILALLFEDFSVYKAVTPIGWGVILYLGLACSCLAYLLQNTALLHISAAQVSVIQCSQPVFTTIFSFIILGEKLKGYGILGALLIVSSIVVASFWESSCPVNLEEKLDR